MGRIEVNKADCTAGDHPDIYDPAPGTEYTYPISDYARETARVLGEGWAAESGYYGAFGTLWGLDGVEVLVYVDADRDCGGLMIVVERGGARTERLVDLPNGAPSDLAELHAVGEIIATAIRSSI